MLLLTTLFLSLVAHIYGAIRTDHEWKNVKTGIKIYNYTHKSSFEKVMNKFEQETCLRWNKSKDQLKSVQGINVLNHHKECFSVEIGPNSSDVPNTIYATNDCMENYYTMLRLMFNALGLSFEHRRNDRDKYIKINNSTVDQSNEYYFLKDKDLGYKTETFGTTYDYGSITHGGAFDYSSHGEQTITPEGNNKYIGWYNKTIGQRSIESFNEYKLFNYFYCNSTCTHHKTQLDCQKGGYQNPNNCGTCICPFPFEGNNCEKIKANEGYCGDTATIFTAKEEEEKRGFATKATCYANITAPVGKKVQIRVHWLNFQISPHDICSPGYQNVVEIISGKDESITGLCLCAYIGGEYQEVTITSDGNEAFIFFKASFVGPNFQFFFKAV
uniref:ZnMc domain-containing protein n=1 Tax=Parastrongyloides trichosuri TaxID=131310 RepID=A0A0N4ZLI9_PARTI